MVGLGIGLGGCRRMVECGWGSRRVRSLAGKDGELVWREEK